MVTYVEESEAPPPMEGFFEQAVYVDFTSVLSRPALESEYQHVDAFETEGVHHGQPDETLMDTYQPERAPAPGAWRGRGLPKARAVATQGDV